MIDAQLQPGSSGGAFVTHSLRFCLPLTAPPLSPLLPFPSSLPVDLNHSPLPTSPLLERVATSCGILSTCP